MTLRLLIPALALLLAGCDIPGTGPDPRAVQREADGKAIGGACRYALRGIEDCYTLNAKASKTAVFAGWKDMDQYMRENNITGQASVVEKEAPAPVVEDKKPPAAKEGKEKAAAAKPKATDTAAEKGGTSAKAAEKPAEKH